MCIVVDDRVAARAEIARNPGTVERKARRDRAKVRARLALEQDGRCRYCREPVGPASKGHGGGPLAATVDHVLPRSRGGTDDPGNLSLACAACNGRKDRLTPDEYELALRWGLA